MVRSQVVVIASGKPFSPSHTAISTSSTPRFLRLGKHLPAKTSRLRHRRRPRSPGMSRSPLVVTPIITEIRVLRTWPSRALARIASTKITGYNRSSGLETHSTPSPRTPPRSGRRSHPVVNPHALSDKTIWSTPSRYRFRFSTITGMNEPYRSRGTTGLDPANSGQRRLRTRTVTRVRAPWRSVVPVAQVLGQLHLKGGLEYPFGQPGQQPTRTDQGHSLSLGLGEQLLSKLPLINDPPHHRTGPLNHLGHISHGHLLTNQTRPHTSSLARQSHTSQGYCYDDMALQTYPLALLLLAQ